MFLLVSVCWTQPRPWCSCWYQCVGHSPGLGVLAGLGHSPGLGVLAGVSVLDTAQALVFLLVSVCWTQPWPWCSSWCQCVGHSPGLGVLAGVNLLDIAQAKAERCEEWRGRLGGGGGGGGALILTHCGIPDGPSHFFLFIHCA